MISRQAWCWFCLVDLPRRSMDVRLFMSLAVCAAPATNTSTRSQLSPNRSGLLHYLPLAWEGRKARMDKCIGLDWIGFTFGYGVPTALRTVFWPTPFLTKLKASHSTRTRHWRVPTAQTEFFLLRQGVISGVQLIAQRPNFKSAFRVVEIVVNTQCYLHLWLLQCGLMQKNNPKKHSKSQNRWFYYANSASELSQSRFAQFFL